MPAGPAKIVWKIDASSRAGNVGVMRGCSRPYPWVTRPSRGVEARLVERVGDRADEPADDSSRQPGVGIERHDVAHAGAAEASVGAGAGQEARRRRSPQQRVQLLELAALALPTHPARSRRRSSAGRGGGAGTGRRRPGASPYRSLSRSMPAAAARQQIVVAVGVLAVGIEPIGQQREPQVALAVAEVVDLQRRPPARRRRPASSAASARRRACASRSARRRPGRAAAAVCGPSDRVTARLTMATAKSEAGPRARMATTSTAPAAIAGQQEPQPRSTSAVTTASEPT